ncbi:MAG TPA: calcium/sodium antiporter [Polyangiaceae bacterium]|nr:calcium/sodium antiporter [Polyangiaceae bacterium]
MNHALLLVIGGFCLYIGAEWLVRGASGLAASLGVRPLVIGLTVVAYGTSAPELAVGVGSALSHQGAIALGNSIGSNIANLGLILGVTALVSPPKVDPSVRRRELPALLAATLAVPLVLLDGRISRLEGGLLLLGALLHSALTLRAARLDKAALGAVQSAAETAGAPRPKSQRGLVGISLVGLLALLGGGKLFVDGASGVARLLGMSEHTVGLTIVAVGTSLPELATSVLAARRGHSEVAIGNVIGSNIFNSLLILGAAGLVGSIEQPLEELRFDLAALGVLTLAGAGFMLRPVVSRLAGALLLAGYVAFLVGLALGAR